MPKHNKSYKGGGQPVLGDLAERVLTLARQLSGVQEVRAAGVRGYKGGQRVKIRQTEPGCLPIAICEPSGEYTVRIQTPDPAATDRALRQILGRNRIAVG